MSKPVFGSCWLGVTFFLLAVHADPILLLSDTFRREPSATISGRLTNSQGKFLGGALIDETNLGSHLVVWAKTNKVGSNRMTVLPQGPYRVTARMVGFRMIANPSFKMEAQDKIALNFCMDCSAVPNSSAGGAGGIGAGDTGGGSSNQTETSTRTTAHGPLALAGSSSLTPNSYLSEDLQLQQGANGDSQPAAVRVNSSISSEIGGYLLGDSINLFPSLKGDEESSLHSYTKSSDSILPSNLLISFIVNPMGSEFERNYGLSPESFASNAGAGLETSWDVPGSDTSLDAAEITERIIVKGNGRSSGGRLENSSSEQVVAALDSEGNVNIKSTVSIVSEPSVLMMMGAGLIVLARVARRSNSRGKENSPVVEVKPSMYQTALSPATSGAMTTNRFLTMVKTTTASSSPATRSVPMGAA